MPDTLLRRWIYAAKPGSWPKLLVPFAFGQALGTWNGLSLGALAVGAAFTVLDLLFIVFLNDWGDREVDAIKRRMFPGGCSPKTIPDGILPAYQLLFAGLGAGVLATLVGFAGGAWLGRGWLGVAALGCLGMFAAYSLPPVRLNYRGGGELLEMLGVGVALPCTHAYLQGGDATPPGASLIYGFALMGLASAIASGLSDERSDRRGGKRTFVTAWGNLAGRRAVEALAFLGACAWALAGLFDDAIPAFVGVLPAMVALGYVGAMLARSGAARTDAFAAQKHYKAALHHAIWRGAAAASMLLVGWNLWPTA